MSLQGTGPEDGKIEASSSGRPRSPQSQGGLGSAGLAITIPGLLLACPLVGAFIGHEVAARFGLGTWPTIVGLVLGIVTALRETMRLLKKIEADEKRELASRKAATPAPRRGNDDAQP